MFARISLRAATGILLIGVLLAASALAYVTHEAGRQCASTNRLVVRTTADIQLLEDARAGFLEESVSVAGYYILRQPQLLAGFRDANARIDSALSRLRVEAAERDPKRLATIDELTDAHERLTLLFERGLALLGNDDLAGVMNVVIEGGLQETAALFYDTLTAEIGAAQDTLVSAQQSDAAAQTASDRLSLGITAAWACLILAGGFCVFRWVVRPIQRVSEASPVIASGDTSARAPKSGPVELASLADDINHMADTLITFNESLERRVAERTAEAERRAQELARKNEELDAFTYSVSHDLKEPLRTLEAFSEFLIEDYSARLDERGRDYLQKLAKASVRMKRLIEDLLMLSRIGRQSGPPARVSVHQMVQDVLEGMRYSVETFGAKVKVEGVLPDALADRPRVEQVFGNLIGNAIKFNRSAEPRVTIGVRGTENGMVTFYVHDNGPGIAPQYHERIFGVFQRLHRREEYEGTGAGLAIVKRAVEAYGGRVWLESEEGAGATFLFTLPGCEHQLALEEAEAA